MKNTHLALGIAAHFSSQPPEVASAQFVGGLLANIVGHIPDPHWSAMMADAGVPCGMAECDCHTLRFEVMSALNRLREDWKEQTEEIGE